MRFFDNLKYWQIKSFTKGACRAMLFSFGVAEADAKSGKFEAKLYSDLATKALTTRPRWKQINKSVFSHASGTELEIKNDDSLANVILNIILIEMREFIFNDKQPMEILTIILEEFKKFFPISDELLEKHEILQKTITQIMGKLGMDYVRKFYGGHE